MNLVERLNTVREGMEAGIEDWPIASMIYEYKAAADRIEALEAEVTDLTDGKAMINKWFQETFKELASTQAEISRLSQYPPLYEELRAVIDSGSESMNHDQAVQEVKHLQEQLISLKDEITGWKQDQKDNHKIQIDQHQQILALKAENLKLRAALSALNGNICGDYADEIIDEALSTPSDTTALTEYRNGVLDSVIEKLLSIGALGDGEYIEQLRAMKEKP